MKCYVYHRLAYPYRVRHRGGFAHQREEGTQHYISGIVPACFRFDTFHGQYDTRPEHTGGFERHLQQCVFSPALYPRPHGTPLLRAVSTRAGYIDESHAGVYYSFGEVCGKVVGNAAVLFFAHAYGRYAQAKEAGVVALQLPFNSAEVVKIFMYQFFQFGVLHLYRLAVHQQHFRDIAVFQAFQQNPFAHHAGSPCYDYLYAHTIKVSQLPIKQYSLRLKHNHNGLSCTLKTTTMLVTIQPCDSIADLKKFAQFPYDLYKENKYWVPPMFKDELHALQPASNPAFKNCEAQFWIAIKHGKVAGRIGAIINKAYNEKTGTHLGRITRIEFIDDKEVSKTLLDTAEKWIKDKGMVGAHGPLGFTNLDHQAILIEGFDYLPSIASEYHLPYYKEHMEAAGYGKEMDWLEFRLKLADAIPEKALKLNEMIKTRYNLKVIHFNNRKEMRAHAPRAFELLNNAFGDLFSFVKMDKELSDFYINKYFSILNPRFVKMIEDEHGELIGFIISLPSLSEAMQKAGGKLFPLGWYHIMQALKKPKVADLLLTAIHPEWQAKGVSAILITELQKVMYEHGVTHAETTGIIETNEKAISHWKNYDHIQHKRKRCFIKMF